jgi:hypothetical protein
LFESFRNFFEGAFDGRDKGGEVGGCGFGASDEEEIYLFWPRGTRDAQDFAQAALDAVPSNGGFKNFCRGYKTHAGGSLTRTESEGEKWPKYNSPSL